MRSITRAASVGTALILLVASTIGAQARKPAASSSSGGEGFGLGYTDVGPVVGLGGLSYGASFALGGRYEHAIKALPDMGDGVLGIQAGVSWYHASQSYRVAGVESYSYDYSYIPIGVTANYHFHLDNKKWDPFVGLGLGYEIISSSVSYSGGYSGTVSGAASSGIFVIGRAGVRYYTSEKLALYADVGAGTGALNLGAMFRLAGPK